MTNQRTNQRKKRQRRRRAATALRLLRTAVITVVVLAIAAVGVWLIFENRIAPSTVTCIVEYEDLIRTYAQKNEIPPAYVAAVIMAESSYRPEAVSSVDAQGLMQILPSTAEWIAGKLDETYTEGCLFDPETNIRYGCWYLGFLMRRYDGDMRCSSSAYHAGQGTVDKWLADPNYSSDGKTLDVIGYDSTNTYVNRVLRYYEKYEEIYAS